jgi:hypothetical protein
MKFFLILLVLFYSGCNSRGIGIEKVSSCDEEVKPKSLNYLEQSYRCHGEVN